MDKIQLAVIMATISDKISVQLSKSGNEMFNILAVTDEVYNNKFIWEIGINGSRIYFVDNFVHLHRLRRQMDENRMYQRTFYYIWDKELLYPCFDFTIDRFIVQEMEQNALFNQMVDIVHEKLGYHIKDYPYHDIQYVIDTNANAPFIWLVGRNTTYLCPMGDVEKLQILIEKLDAVPDARHSYKCYVFGGEVLKLVPSASVRKDAEKLIKELIEN